MMVRRYDGSPRLGQGAQQETRKGFVCAGALDAGAEGFLCRSSQPTKAWCKVSRMAKVPRVPSCEGFWSRAFSSIFPSALFDMFFKRDERGRIRLWLPCFHSACGAQKLLEASVQLILPSCTHHSSFPSSIIPTSPYHPFLPQSSLFVLSVLPHCPSLSSLPTPALHS